MWHNKKYIYYVLEGALALLIIIGLTLKINNKENTPKQISEQINTEELSIEIFSPLPQQSIESPLHITGQARGDWFSDGNIPITLIDWDGLLIAEGLAKAKGNGQGEEFVAFEATISFEKPSDKKNGFLIFKGNDQSGLAQYNDFWEIPIIFK